MEPRRRLQDWHHMLAMSLVMVTVSAALVYLFLHFNFIPNPASNERGLIDNFMKLLFAIASIFFTIVLTILAYTLIFFRKSKGDDTDARPIRGNTALELTWTIIPLLIVVGLGIYGSIVLNEMSAPNPQAGKTQSVFSIGVTIPGEMPVSETAAATGNELVVNVTASRFAWQFEYPDYGITSYVLEVPVERRILFKILSKDVVHSFWVQEWGPKQDAIPGMSPSLRITPTELGQFLVQCSQLCGYDHTDMTAPVRVVSPVDFDTWVAQQQSSNSTATAPGVQVMIDLTAENIAFDKTVITVPAGAEVMVNFNNKDSGVPHNFAVYTDSSAVKSIYVGQVITGPKTVTYTFNAPTTTGTYFFRCDIHPTVMTGSFVVQ
jgi:cytochrome c oxidase subunit II